ncbi:MULTISPECIES: DUF349 domain-containing protein [Glutamicibacter]|uniref:DUF349 domain-containing protein n=2 Tax=Glutamicibacter arilaitensis TaxID=256701 RepID=A0A4Y8TY60_9MICC|nr:MULTISPECIES: DUF349 domain-containing protein [Glutamicibacter]TFH57110.1 DUF349 domain-containing protein [Glutamicibacter arilaitensis]CBT75955.1 conserved hypothetical protein [Glutamicibacter arilaitensis Re117]HCH48091.1 DUF349 domain-containing protein [Glutamicibacter sp.]HCJ55435.1 DUF349 domain-containing protein [Glutamicibacter sp.]HCM94051.1 DUF349 domain-containing protein [Glutamicibacter sp.]
MTTSQQSDDSPKTPLPQAQKPAAKPVVAPSVAHTTPLDEAAKFARVTEDGHVFVIIDGAESPVGQYPDATQEEALGYFVRKYDDALSQLMLLEQRVAAKAPANELSKAVQALSATVAERHMVGDIPALETRLETVRVAIEALTTEQRKANDQARAEQLAARESIVEQAEALAGKRPEQIQWKTASAAMNELFEAWKGSQRSAVRLPRATEDALWKRFRSARTTFDRHRRAYFSQLDSTNAAAKSVKEELIARAEALQESTDWAATAAEYRKLMDEWKKSRRASRKDDDQLWSRFRAAQDVFFQARAAANAKIDEEYSQNLVVKEALLEEARALLPIKDLAAAKNKLDSIRTRWEAAGKVPRNDLQRIESALRQVEDAVKGAEDEQWRRSNPETKARSNSMLSQLQDTISALEDDLEAAKAKGNAKQIAAAQEALDARRMWLSTLEKSAADFQ